MIVQLDYPPSTNRAWRMHKGRMVQSKIARDWKKRAGWMARAAGFEPLEGPVRVVATLHPKMTARGQTSRVRIDIDNALKTVLDALNGVAYGDDRQIVETTARLGEPMPDGALTVSVEAA
jgi:crossover junction endodeoxyribonuclease RusA